MTNDRELLEAAAKAAGIKLADEIDSHIPSGGLWIVSKSGRDAVWDPLRDDGDALRLAVKLRLDVMTSCTRDEIQIGGSVRSTTFQPIDGDRLAATRRAIVRAAAALAPTP